MNNRGAFTTASNLCFTRFGVMTSGGAKEGRSEICRSVASLITAVCTLSGSVKIKSLKERRYLELNRILLTCSGSKSSSFSPPNSRRRGEGERERDDERDLDLLLLRLLYFRSDR